MKLIVKALIFSILFFLAHFGMGRQKMPSQDTAIYRLLEQTHKNMHLWNFQEAEKQLVKVKSLLGEHYIVSFLEGMLPYMKHAPIGYQSAEIEGHIKLMRKTVELADRRLKSNKNDPEALFFKMTAKSIIMRYYAQTGQSMKAVGEMEEVYGLIRTGNKRKNEYKEFYFTSGIYNYLREGYPEKHPIYKPFAVMFEKGDKALGLEQLEYAAKNCLFTSSESYNFLSYLYLSYENKTDKALEYMGVLVQRYPHNFYNMMRYTELLIRLKKYQEAEIYIHKLSEYQKDKFYPMVVHTFRGMIAQWRDKNIFQAELYYRKAENLAVELASRSVSMHAYIYGGLYKYHKVLGEKEKAKNYLQKAKEYDHQGYLKEMETVQ